MLWLDKAPAQHVDCLERGGRFTGGWTPLGQCQPSEVGIGHATGRHDCGCFKSETHSGVIRPEWLARRAAESPLPSNKFLGRSATMPMSLLDFACGHSCHCRIEHDGRDLLIQAPFFLCPLSLINYNSSARCRPRRRPRNAHAILRTIKPQISRHVFDCSTFARNQPAISASGQSGHLFVMITSFTPTAHSSGAAVAACCRCSNGSVRRLCAGGGVRAPLV